MAEDNIYSSLSVQKILSGDQNELQALRESMKSSSFVILANDHPKGLEIVQRMEDEMLSIFTKVTSNIDCFILSIWANLKDICFYNLKLYEIN